MGEALPCQQIAVVTVPNGQVAIKERNVDDYVSVTKMGKKSPSSNCEPPGAEESKRVKEGDKFEVMKDQKEDDEEAHLAEVSSHTTLENKEKDRIQLDAKMIGPVQAAEGGEDKNRENKVPVEMHEDHLEPQRESIDPSVQGKDILPGSTQSLGDVDKVPHSVEHDLSSNSASGSSSTVKNPPFNFNRLTKEFDCIDPEITDPDVTEEACMCMLQDYIPDRLQ